MALALGVPTKKQSEQVADELSGGEVGVFVDFHYVRLLRQAVVEPLVDPGEPVVSVGERAQEVALFEGKAERDLQVALAGEAVSEGRRIMQAEAAGNSDESAPPKWHGTDLASATPDEMEAVLSDTVLKEFKVRLGRIGIDYQTPLAP